MSGNVLYFSLLAKLSIRQLEDTLTIVQIFQDDLPFMLGFTLRQKIRG